MISTEEIDRIAYQCVKDGPASKAQVVAAIRSALDVNVSSTAGPAKGGITQLDSSNFLAHPADAGAVDYRAKLYKLVWTYFNNNCGENVYNLMESARAHFALVGAEGDAGAVAVEQAKPKPTWNRASLVERLYNDTPTASLSVEAGAEIQRLRAEFAASQLQATPLEATSEQMEPEPNMLWLSDDNEVFANGPDEFADDYADNYLRPGEKVEVSVDCAYRGHKRTMQISVIDNGTDDAGVEWEWTGKFRAAEGEATSEHLDDRGVDLFAAAMKAKLAESRAKGRSGWHSPTQCPADMLQAMLVDHVAKGDPVDVGNFAMMLFNRGQRTATSERKPLTDAARDVLAERQRQVEQEGWTPAHDDKYQCEELRAAALCYMRAKTITTPGGLPAAWPWYADWWRPTTDRRNLIKSGALILAEIERIDRIEQHHGIHGGGK